ncbi:MAG: hypothetical protein ACI4C1_07960 [Lachnospiraceae bacterium]
MKKVIGWILIILGGFFCIVDVMCIPVAFTADDVTLGERIFMLVLYIVMAIACGMVCSKGFKLKAGKTKRNICHKKSVRPAVKPTAFDVLLGKKGRKTTPSQNAILTEELMTSQLPALYLQENNTVYRDNYVWRLESIGFKKKDAEKMFDFECEVIRKFHKQYLLQPQFSKMWFFGLNQPFFQQYPKTKEDILKERYLTVSELCKIIDEAEWHFWNSHERELSDGVWQEICEWRLKGSGAKFAIQYFEMIGKATGIPEESIAKLSSEQGNHLSQYKWR